MNEAQRTGGRNDRPILNELICTDDHGDLVYRCHYTDKPVALRDSVYIGPCIPQVHGTYVCAPDAGPAFKASKRSFDECEANCNTCRHLKRQEHAKGRAGFLYGTCEQADMGAHPYANRAVAGVFPFHPDDHMGMPCYEARWS